MVQTMYLVSTCCLSDYKKLIKPNESGYFKKVKMDDICYHMEHRPLWVCETKEKAIEDCRKWNHSNKHIYYDELHFYTEIEVYSEEKPAK